MQNLNTRGLADVMHLLSDSDQRFARDLIRSYNSRGRLSDPQWTWVVKLTQRATQPAQPAPVESVGDFTGVMRLFRFAKQHLKFPKIALQVGTQPVQLSLAGSMSKYEGQVQVTDGRPYGQNIWFGRVDQAGTWTQGRAATEQELSTVRGFLSEFSQDPAGVAKKHGRLTGRCCFCNTKLTDERSTAAGFGPTCAKNFGLETEWKAATAVLESAEAQAA